MVIDTNTMSFRRI